MKNPNKKITAFTLIELLVVIVIIGILSGIGVAGFNSHNDKAKSAKLTAECAQINKCNLIRSTCEKGGDSEVTCKKLCDVSGLSCVIGNTTPGIIVDIGLQSAILSKLGKSDWLTVTQTDLEGITGSIPVPKGAAVSSLSGIGNLINLETIAFDYSGIPNMPAEIGNLINLTSLSLHSSDIESIPKEIGNLVNLTYLNVYGNQISSLPPEIGNLVNLEFISLIGNPISSLPAQFKNLSKLTQISLRNTGITCQDSNIPDSVIFCYEF